MLIFFGVCAYVFEKNEDVDIRKYVTIAAFVVFYVFFAFRGYVYTDWVSYTDFYAQVEWGDILSIQVSDDGIIAPGFVLLCLLCRIFSSSYFFLVFVCITIDLILFLRFLKKREVDDIALTFALFIVFGGLIIMFNLLRNALAIFIFLNALEFIERRKPLQYFALILLAFSIHLSAIIFVPLYFFLHIRLNKWVFAGVVAFSILFYLSGFSIAMALIQLLGLEDIIGNKVTSYTESYSTARSLSLIGTAIKLALAGLVFIYYDDIIERFKGRVIIINSLLMYFIMFYMLGEFKVLSDRFSTLFYYSYWILWADLLRVFYWKNNRRLFAVFLSLYSAIIIVTSIRQPVQQYDNILVGAKSYQERLAIFNRTYEADE